MRGLDGGVLLGIVLAIAALIYGEFLLAAALAGASLWRATKPSR